MKVRRLGGERPSGRAAREPEGGRRSARAGGSTSEPPHGAGREPGTRKDRAAGGRQAAEAVPSCGGIFAPPRSMVNPPDDPVSPPDDRRGRPLLAAAPGPRAAPPRPRLPGPNRAKRNDGRDRGPVVLDDVRDRWPARSDWLGGREAWQEDPGALGGVSVDPGTDPEVRSHGPDGSGWPWRRGGGHQVRNHRPVGPGSRPELPPCPGGGGMDMAL